jgi:hypothetical protein
MLSTKGINMTALELYKLLDLLDIDYDVIEIFDGSRWLSFKVEEEEKNEEV